LKEVAFLVLSWDRREHHEASFIDLLVLGDAVFLQVGELAPVRTNIQIQQDGDARWAHLQRNIPVRGTLRKKRIFALLVVELRKLIEELAMVFQLAGLLVMFLLQLVLLGAFS
jgi:hypothetical protein